MGLTDIRGATIYDPATQSEDKTVQNAALSAPLRHCDNGSFPCSYVMYADVVLKLDVLASMPQVFNHPHRLSRTLSHGPNVHSAT